MINPFPVKRYTYCGLNNYFTFTFSPEMDFYKCWEHVGNSTHKFGYLDENAKIVITNTKYYEWMNKIPTKIDSCRNCKYIINCGGGCIINSYNRYGTYNNSGCFKTKGVLENQIKFLCENGLIEKEV